MTRGRGAPSCRVLATLLATALFGSWAAASPAPPTPPGSPPDPSPAPAGTSTPVPAPAQPEAELLLALRVQSTVVSDAILAYPRHGRVLLPLGEVCQLLELAITVDAANQTADGFALSSRRVFHLDVKAGSVTFEGKPKRFERDGIEPKQDDIFVDTQLLAEWLPMDIEVDLYGATIIVKPREPFPIDLRSERQKKLENVLPTGPVRHPPITPLPYALLDGPFADLSFQYTRQPQVGGGATSTYQASGYFTGDVLGLEGSGYVGSDLTKVTDARVLLGRKDPEGMLGPLHVREFGIGDVLAPGLELVAGSSTGTGFLVSSYPLQLPAAFDRNTFRGPLPPGWEVELYRNETLVTAARSRPDGLYEFLDVPLLFGLNLFRLEFYGPQGLRRTETHVYNVAESLVPPGALYYRVVGSDPSVRLAGDTGTNFGRRVYAQGDYGISKHLSLAASVSEVSLLSGTQEYATLGGRGSFGLFALNVDLAAAAAGGVAWQGTLQSRFGQALGFTLQHAELYGGFESERFLSSADLKSRTILRLDTGASIFGIPRIGLVVNAQLDHFGTTGDQYQAAGTLSAFVRGFSVSNLTTFIISKSDTATDTTATGQLLLSKYLPVFSVRGQLDYTVRPQAEVTAAALILEGRQLKEVLLTLEYDRTFTSKENRWSLTASRSEGTFGFGVGASYSDLSGFGANLLLSVSLARTPRGAWHRQARPMAGGGAAAPRAFLDTNGNGKYDPGEKLLPGVGFSMNGAMSAERTRDDGTTFLPNLQVYQPLDLAVAPATLEDPFYRPVGDGVRFVPRPGKAFAADLPIQVYGEVTGTISVKTGGDTRPIGAVPVALVGSDGKAVRSARSGYDGFYDIADVPPGKYTLTASPGPTEKRFTVTATRPLEFQASGTIHDGINFILEGADAGAPAATPASNLVPTLVPTPAATQVPTSPPTPAATLPSTPVPTRASTGASTPAPTPAATPVSTRGSTPAPTPVPTQIPTSVPKTPVPSPVPTPVSTPVPTLAAVSGTQTSPASGSSRRRVFGVQVGSFLKSENAKAVAADCQRRFGVRCVIVSFHPRSKATFHRVLAGRFADPGAAEALRRTMRLAGFETGPVHAFSY